MDKLASTLVSWLNFRNMFTRQNGPTYHQVETTAFSELYIGIAIFLFYHSATSHHGWACLVPTHMWLHIHREMLLFIDSHA